MALNVTRYFGFAKESTYGTVGTTFNYIDAASAEIDPSGDNVVAYEGASGLDYLFAAGNYEIGGSFEIPVDDVAIGYLFKWALGDVTSTGTGSITHTFFPKTNAVMDSFSVKVGKDVAEHIFLGCAVEKMKLVAKTNEIVTCEFDIVGAKDTKGAIASPSAYSMGNIFTGADVTMDIGGTNVAVENLTLELNMNPDIKGSIALGSRFAKKVYRGALEAALSFELAFNDTTELERFWGSATGPTNSVNGFAANINIGSNLDIVIPSGVYTSLEQPLSGRDRIVQAGKIRCFRSADGLTGPISFALTNSKPTGTYI